MAGAHETCDVMLGFFVKGTLGRGQIRTKLATMVVSGTGVPGTVFLIYINLFIYLFLAASGLCCCAQGFSSCGEQGLLFVAVPGLLIAVASLVAEHGL